MQFLSVILLLAVVALAAAYPQRTVIEKTIITGPQGGFNRGPGFGGPNYGNGFNRPGPVVPNYGRGPGYGVNRGPGGFGPQTTVVKTTVIRG